MGARGFAGADVGICISLGGRRLRGRRRGVCRCQLLCGEGGTETHSSGQTLSEMVGVGGTGATPS